MDTTAKQSGATVMLRSEEFDPKFRWTKGGESETLVLDVPGFKKDNLKVQLDNHGRIRVSGVRLTEDNKWYRFSKDFQVPKECGTGKIRARLENSSLFVIMPLDQPVDTKRAAAAAAVIDQEATKDNSMTTDEKTAGEEVAGGRLLQEKIQHRYSRKSKVLKSAVVVMLFLLGVGSSYIIMKRIMNQPLQMQQVFETAEDDGISQWIKHP